MLLNSSNISNLQFTSKKKKNFKTFNKISRFREGGQISFPSLDCPKPRDLEILHTQYDNELILQW